MRKVRGWLLTFILIGIFLLSAKPVLSQEKSPAESQVDKATDFWNQIEDFTEEPGMGKKDEVKDKNIKQEPQPPAKQSPEKSIEEKPKQEIVTPVVPPPPADKKPPEEPIKNTKPSRDRDKTLDEGIDDIAEQITSSFPGSKTTTVAIVDFNDLQGKVTMLGRYMSEELITRLFQARRFKVIERSLLEKALGELHFNATDLVDPDAAQQLGKVIGAEALVTGTLTDLGRLIKVNGRVIKVETGEVLGAAGTQIIKTMSVEDMMKNVLVPAKGQKSGQKSPGEISKDTQATFKKGGQPLQQMENDFLFELENCEVSFQIATCHFSVINKSNDRNFAVGRPNSWSPISRVFDDTGNEYHASNYRLANKSGGRIGSLLVSETPVKLDVEFKGISQQASTISLMEIYGDGFVVKFRDVPLIR